MTAPRHHTVQVPATSANLGPGFDAFGLALQRHLVVQTVDRAAQSDRVRLLDGADVGISCGDDNLVWRSFVAFCEEHDHPVPDVALVCRSEIPLERGLGSSSSAIVAGLALARASTGVACGDPGLVSLAARLEGHPDNVAPAVLGGLVACALDDDGRLVIRRVTPAPALAPLVFVPVERQATVTARAVLPEHLDVAAVSAQAARAGHVLAGLAGAWPLDPRLAGDRLHEPPRLEVMPGSARVLTDVRAAGIHAWLSGAGPSVAAVVATHRADLVREAAAIAARHGFELLEARFDLAGVIVCADGTCTLAKTQTCVQCPRRRV